MQTRILILAAIFCLASALARAEEPTEAKDPVASAAPEASAAAGAVAGKEAKKPIAKARPRAKEPDRIEVQHILIAFDGTIPNKSLDRNQKAAEKLAGEVLAKAKKKGSDFSALVKEFSDDTPAPQGEPGVYKMSNRGVAPSGPGEYSRERMVPAFGNVGFKLGVGEIGLARYHAKDSPFGFHIIKRLK